MEPLFENRYYGNWKGLAEFYQRFRTGPRLRVMIPSVLIYVGLIMFSLWKGIFDRMATPFLVLGIVYALLPLLPVFLAKTTIKNEKNSMMVSYRKQWLPLGRISSSTRGWRTIPSSIAK